MVDRWVVGLGVLPVLVALVGDEVVARYSVESFGGLGIGWCWRPRDEDGCDRGPRAATVGEETRWSMSTTVPQELIRGGELVVLGTISPLALLVA